MGIYFIPPGESFVDVLARELLAQGMEILPRVCVFVPSNRAVRSLSEALLRQNKGAPLLLPKMFPLGDADLELLIPEVLGNAALPPAVADTERHIRLALLIQMKSGAYPVTTQDALRLAESFLALADDFTREKIEPFILRDLVPEDFAEHWQKSLSLLSTVMEEWPLVLREEGKVNALTRRNMEMALLAAHWKQHPPRYPIYAAGSTGSIPSTAELLKVIAELPDGKVILPGLDKRMDKEEWRVLPPTHPQYGLKQLLQHFDCPREKVSQIGAGSLTAHSEFLRSVMTPANRTDDWPTIALAWDEALEGITSITCEHEHEEAGVVALLLRDVLEKKDATAMLVTHDRELARHVAAIIQRYGENAKIDDSAGVPITTRTPFIYLKLIAEYVCIDSSPVKLLALLKHPLLRLSMEPGDIREAARQLEASLLRGVRTWNSWEEFEKNVREGDKVSDAARDVLLKLHRNLHPLRELCGKRIRFSELLELHVAIAETMAQPVRLGEAHDGAKLLQCLERISVASERMGWITAQEYPEILTTLLGSTTYRQPYDFHPRLRILSPLEARLQQADVVILSGLNEGVWPPQPVNDPWLSIPMREKAGLKSSAYHVGQSAHDFWMLAHAERVIFTRARKLGGTPTVPCRWLLRMDTLLSAAGEKTKANFYAQGETWRAWHAEYCKTDNKTPALRPAPQPPVSARPTFLPVTSIKKLMDDPYEVYAQRVLGLKELDPLDQQPGKREFGIAVHQALQHFFNDYARMPENAETILHSYLEKETYAYKQRHRAAIFWEQQLQVIARHAVIFAREGERDIISVHSEEDVEWQVDAGGQAITLHGRIDRKEIYADRSTAIIDYKTGAGPSVSGILDSRDPQLGLLGTITAKHGGKIRQLAIWPLRGKEEAPKITEVKEDDIAILLTETEAGVTALLSGFMQPQTPYISLADQETHDKAYDHLARVGEWG